MPAPMMQTSTCRFSASGAHSGSVAVADQSDWWRGMGVLDIARPTAKNAPSAPLSGTARAPPALELCLDRRGAMHLRQRALFLRLLLLLPLRHQSVGLGQGVLERAARRQRLLEKGAAKVGEVVFVGAAKGSAVGA